METSSEITLFRQLQVSKNIYSLKIQPNIYSIFGKIGKEEVYLTIQHDGYTPNLDSDRSNSHFGEYLSNLSDKLISDYTKANKIKKRFDHIAEVYSDSKGEIFRYSKRAD